MHYESKLDRERYNKLLARYKDIPRNHSDAPGSPKYDFEPYLTESSVDKINAEYMESKFKLFCKPLDENYSQEDKDAIEKELHSIFGTLSEVDQIWANRIIYDISTGELNPEGKRLTDLIASYKTKHENDIIRKLAHAIGVDEEKLRALKNDYDGSNINRNGRFDNLKSTLQIDIARTYIESIDGKKLKDYEIRMRADALLRKFIEEGTTIGIQ